MRLIAIDAGHGMNTSGKRTPLFPDGSFMHEREFNKATANYLQLALIRCGFKTLLTAPEDNDLSLRIRTNRANAAKADLCISIHANAASGSWGNANGIETFYYPTSTEGKKAAEIIHKYLLQGTKLRDRKCKSANLHMVREPKMPAILVECGFMDNVSEALLLKTNNYREECAEDICQGICEYFKVVYISKNIMPELILGDKNESVKFLQVQLIKKGYKLEADGSFGPITQLAVKQFQAKAGLAQTGLVRQDTWDKLM